jgi:hypothetical protein
MKDEADRRQRSDAFVVAMHTIHEKDFTTGHFFILFEDKHY